MEKLITYVGLDVHKETIAVALADEGKRGDVREHGKIANTPAPLAKLMNKLSQGGRGLKCCYEAGPCGYGILTDQPSITSGFNVPRSSAAE